MLLEKRLYAFAVESLDAHKAGQHGLQPTRLRLRLGAPLTRAVDVLGFDDQLTLFSMIILLSTGPKWPYFR
jgi:hypothetical protein